MISARITSKIPLEQGKIIKHRTRIVTLDCPAGSEDYLKFKFALLKQIAEDPSLTLCNSEGFQKLVMEHNGRHWEITCEAIIKESGP